VANPNAAALIATARSAVGGFPGASSPRGMNGEASSPLMQAWAQQAGIQPGWATTVYSAALGLPRTFDTFREGQFGPFEPIHPMPIDVGEAPSGRPRPRRWQFPVGWNLPVGQPGTEGIKLANFQVLRDYGEMPSIPRACIEVVKQDILNLDWDIVPTDDAQRAMQGNPSKRTDFEKRKAEAMEFFSNPDPDQFDGFDEWASAIIEDMLVLDAMALYVQPAGGRGNGPLGSNLGALAALDGSTIRPLLDDWGSRPRPPEPSYQQLIWGVPRVDLMDLINLGPDSTIEDIKELNPVLMNLTEEVDQWDGTQLMYVRMSPRNWTPYGFGPLEQGILPAAIILARQTWQWQFFQQGSLPSVFLDPGESIATAEEARQLQEAINALGGDLANMHQVIVLPPGAKTQEQRPIDLTSQFDEWTAALMCMPFGLSITDLGITPKISSLESPTSAKQQAKSANDRSVRRSTIPRTKKLKRKVFDRIIQGVLGQQDMQWSWGIEDEGESEGDQIDQAVKLVSVGLATIDEERIEMGKDPLGLPETTLPIIITGAGATPLHAALAAGAAAQIAQATAPAPGAPPPTPGTPPALGPGSPGGPPKKPSGGGGTNDNASPAHDASEAVTANPAEQHVSSDAKAISAELSQLRRYLRRGNELENFAPKVLHPAALHAGKRANTPDAAIALVAKAQRTLQRRDAALAPIRAKLSSDLGRLANRLRSSQGLGKFTKKAAASGPADRFVVDAIAALQDGHNAALVAGADQAGAEFAGLNVKDDWTAAANARATEQGGFLADLADALSNPDVTEAYLGNSIDKWAASLTPSYEEGYVTAATDGTDSPILIRWNLGNSEKSCALCEERDGETFTEEDLPGYPGDGDFGGDLCEGGPLCACYLTLEMGEEDLGRTDEAAGRQMALEGDVTESVQVKDFSLSGGPGGTAQPLAFVPFDLTGPGKPKKPKKRKKPKLVERFDDHEAAKRAMRFYDSDDYMLIDRGIFVKANGAGLDTPVAAGLAVVAADTGRVLLLQRALDDNDESADPAAGTWEFGGGHIEGDETPWDAATREWSEEVGTPVPPGHVIGTWISPNGVYQGFAYSTPNEDAVHINLDYPHVSNPDAPVHAKPESAAWFEVGDLAGMPSLRSELAADLPMVLRELRRPATKQAPPRQMGQSIDEGDVQAYLEKHYPDADLGWVSRCTWAQDNVLLDQINWKDRPGGIDEDKVASMADNLDDGWMPHPCVLVAPDADAKMEIADGYHRCAANDEAGIQVIRAWVGSPKPGATGWMADIRAMQFTAENHSIGKAAMAKQLRKQAKLHKAGNPDALRDWYNDGADGQIDWGGGGDWQQCVDIASNYMGVDEAQGFCQLRHMDSTGEPAGPGAHKSTEATIPAPGRASS
jgi:8-oxo-dGTP pyrophosphatase MutT (NUDIX family)